MTYGSPERRNLLKAAPPLCRPTSPTAAALWQAVPAAKPILMAFVESAVNQVGEQAFRKKAADAVDGHGRPPFAANPHRGVKRPLALHATQADVPAEATVPDDDGLASALA